MDISPAIFIWQENIIQNLAHKKYIRIPRSYQLRWVKDEFNDADFVCLSPKQGKMIPDKSVDIAVATDCLHAMTTANVEKFFGHLD